MEKTSILKTIKDGRASANKLMANNIRVERLYKRVGTLKTALEKEADRAAKRISMLQGLKKVNGKFHADYKPVLETFNNFLAPYIDNEGLILKELMSEKFNEKWPKSVQKIAKEVFEMEAKNIHNQITRIYNDLITVGLIEVGKPEKESKEVTSQVSQEVEA